MLLLAMGSVRGSGILFHKTATPLACRCFQAVGIVLLGLSFFLQMQTMKTPIIAAINWIGIDSIEIFIMALICTLMKIIKQKNSSHH